MEEYYLNQPRNHECIKLPGKDAKYLLKENLLSEFFAEEDKAEARSNLGITPLLEELKALIKVRPVEQGSVQFGLEPTDGTIDQNAYNEILSSAVIYKALQKYYEKEELDQWREELLADFNQIKDNAKIIIDNELDKTSTNVVQNKAIATAIQEIREGYTRLSNIKADKEALLNYYNTAEIDGFINQINEKLSILETFHNIIPEEENNNGENSNPNNSNQEENNSEQPSTNTQITELENALTNVRNILQNLNDNVENNITNIENRISLLEQNIQNLENNIIQESTRAQAEKILLESRLIALEQNPALSQNIKHVFLTPAQYESLESYDQDTLYFIVENSGNSHFGDAFPLTLG